MHPVKLGLAGRDSRHVLAEGLLVVGDGVLSSIEMRGLRVPGCRSF